MQEPVQLAHKSLVYYLQQHKLMTVPENISELLKGRAGVFVSLKKNGQLRGCIGTFMPTQKNIAAEIIVNAVGAGTHDPRFLAVERAEIPQLEISVDILSEPERVQEMSELDVKKYGVIVKKGMKSGLLLPDLEGVDTVEDQISITKQKAGIGLNEEVELYRFYVTRYK